MSSLDYMGECEMCGELFEHHGYKTFCDDCKKKDPNLAYCSKCGRTFSCPLNVLVCPEGCKRTESMPLHR